MLCQTCHTNQATVHLANIPYPALEMVERHFCLGCAEELRTSDPLLSPKSVSLPPVHRKPVTSISLAARVKVQSVARRLAELDSVFKAFCERRQYSFVADDQLWPNRRATAYSGIHRQLVLAMDITFVALLERGFYPGMPWSLCAMASLLFPGNVSPRLARMPTAAPLPASCPSVIFHLLDKLPFSEIAVVLDEQLENGFSLLKDLSREDILAKGQQAKAGQGPFHLFPPW
ncbi:MAG TPA: hypothetical protein VG167_13720 [Verrucomicrobiae bacterium]|nr:hypothetical protein [Verrucomicrobiae bacterium]